VYFWSIFFGHDIREPIYFQKPKKWLTKYITIKTVVFTRGDTNQLILSIKIILINFARKVSTLNHDLNHGQQKEKLFHLSLSFVHTSMCELSFYHVKVISCDLLPVCTDVVISYSLWLSRWMTEVLIRAYTNHSYIFGVQTFANGTGTSFLAVLDTFWAQDGNVWLTKRWDNWNSVTP